MVKRTDKLTGNEYGYKKLMILHYKDPELLLLQFVIDILVTMHV